MNRSNLQFNFFFSLIVLVLLSHLTQAQKKNTPPTSAKNAVKKAIPTTNTQPQKTKPTPYIVSYQIAESGDTMNRLDNENKKQGWWIENNPTSKIIEGERDVFIGAYLNNQRNGVWRNYLGPQLVLEENYKLGERDGEVKIYEDGKLSILGHYQAINRTRAYDTLDLEDFDGSIIRKIIKTDKGSYRQGEWIYYYPNSSKIMRTEYYFLDELTDVKEYDLYDSLQVKKIDQLRQTTPKPAMWNYNKKTEAPRFTDIRSDGKGLKPNVRTAPRKTK